MISPRASRRRWWLTGGVAAWAAVLTGLAMVDRDGTPTVRDQRTVAQAMPEVDRAAAQLFAALGPTPVAEIGSLDVGSSCQVTPVRDGARVRRDILVYVPPGAGPAILDTVRTALPVGYRASVLHLADTDVHTLDADAGEFVQVNGVVEQDGAVVRLSAASGCRPLDGAPPTPARSPVELGRDVLQTAGVLNVREFRDQREERLTCPNGGSARTTSVLGGPAPADVSALLPSGTAVLSEPTRYAARDGALATVVTRVDADLRISVTRGC